MILAEVAVPIGLEIKAWIKVNYEGICHLLSLANELNYHDQKIRWTFTQDVWKHWAAVSTLLGLISGVYRDLHHWRSNQWPKSRNSTTEPLVNIADKWRHID